MRFSRIEIPAFGPFTGLDLDFPRTGADLHLFHGANEAGKSSLLRCLRSFLFGIDPKTPDNFLHPYGNLLVIGDLEKRDGTVGRFKRRKRKIDLFDREDTPLQETALAAYLGGVDRNYFESMFGMGARELHAGAESLLRGDGKLGEALFSASLGGTPVDRVIAALESEASELFRARGSSVIRTQRKLLDDSLRQSRDLLMKPDLWEEAVRTIDDLEEQIRRSNEAKVQLVNRRAWLERCRDALPITGQYRELTRELATMDDVPALRGIFSGDLTKALEAWTHAKARQAPLRAAIESLEGELAKTELAPDVLAEKIEIHRLHSALELHREQKLGHGAKKLEVSQREKRIEVRRLELVITAPVSELESHRLTQVELLEARQLAKEVLAADQQVANSETSLANLRDEMGRLTGELLSPTGDIGILESVVARTQKFEEVARGLPARSLRLEAGRNALQRALLQLPGAGEDPALARQLPIPLRSAIEKFRDDFERLSRSSEAHSETRAKARTRLSEIEAEIQRIQRQKHLPTADDLRTARQERNRTWDAVLHEWKQSGSPSTSWNGKPLESAYPDAVEAADEIADRLLSDADAVAQFEQKLSERGVQQSLADEADRNILSLEGEQAVLQTAWSAAWESSSVPPADPKVMGEWRNLWEEFCRTWDRWDEDQLQLNSDRTDLLAASAELSAAMDGQSGDLPELLASAVARISSHNQALGATREVNRQLVLKRQACEQTEALLPNQKQTARIAAEKWTECRTRHGLSERLNPNDNLSILQERVNLFQDFDRWREIAAEAAGLETSIQFFEQNVALLCTRLKRTGGETEANLSTLWQECRQAEAAADRATTLQAQLDARRGEETTLATEVAAARTLLDQLLQEASLTDELAVPDFVERFNLKRTKSERIAVIRDSLSALAREQELNSFVEKVETEGGDQVAGALEQVGREIADIEREQETLRTSLHDWRQKRQTMENASDAAAQAFQQAELTASSLRRNAERFAKLQLGVVTLKSRIDRFRKQNQGPFMDKAGRWFAEITGGAFAGLSTHFGDGDQPVIAGMRKGGEILTVEQMSTGTRDQLYLALRLAGLELHLADNEPMPLILDDLLVQFDEGRSIHTLKTLSQFSRQSQILLFTHHEHLVELALKHLGPDGFHLHRLPKESAISSP